MNDDERYYPLIVGRRRFYPGRIRLGSKHPDGSQPSRLMTCRAELIRDNTNKIKERNVSEPSLEWKIGAKRSRHNHKALKKRIGRCICRAVIDIKNSGKRIIKISGSKNKNNVKENKSKSNKDVDDKEDLTNNKHIKEIIVNNASDDHEKIQIVQEEDIEKCSSNDDAYKENLSDDFKICTFDNVQKDHSDEVPVHEDISISKELPQPNRSIIEFENVDTDGKEEDIVSNEVDANCEGINDLTFNKDGDADSSKSVNLEGSFDLSNSCKNNTLSSVNGSNTKIPLTVHTPRSSQDLTSYWKKKREWSRRASIYKSMSGYKQRQHKTIDLPKSTKNSSFFIKFYTKMKNLEALQSFLPIGQKTRITQRNDITCVHWQANP